MFWLKLLTSKLGRGIALAGAALLAIVTFGALKKKQGRTEAETDALRDGAERQEKGRNAVQDLRDADRDELDSQLRDNDSDWK